MRILVVEDYESLAHSLEVGLRESGFAVDISLDGEEGLWFAETNEYDAIVLDILLPGLDGLSILKKLRSNGRNTPVLLLTSKDEVDDRVKGLDAGADDYLPKPFAFEELVSRLRALVRRRYGHRNPIIGIADLTIDTVRHEVTRASKKMDLTAREYALLEYLARRQGELVTRSDIWQHVYEFRSEATSNVVDVYISSLRKKLDSHSSGPLIHTKRGEGFILEDRSGQ